MAFSTPSESTDRSASWTSTSSSTPTRAVVADPAAAAASVVEVAETDEATAEASVAEIAPTVVTDPLVAEG